MSRLTSFSPSAIGSRDTTRVRWSIRWGMRRYGLYGLSTLSRECFGYPCPTLFSDEKRTYAGHTDVAIVHPLHNQERFDEAAMRVSTSINRGSERHQCCALVVSAHATITYFRKDLCCPLALQKGWAEDWSNAEGTFGVGNPTLKTALSNRYLQ